VRREPRGIKAERPYSYGDLEAVALQFRQTIGLSPHERIDALKLFDQVQDLKILVGVKQFGLGCRVGHLADGLEAQAQFLPDRREFEVVLTEETYRWLEEGNPRGSWSFIHEVDHIQLHSSLLRSLASLSPISREALFRGRPKNHRFCEDTEWQADALTGAVIMPALGIHRIETASESDGPWLIQKIAVAFGASPQAAAHRLDTYRNHSTQLLRKTPSDEIDWARTKEVQ
jgi:hypothetical protein